MDAINPERAATIQGGGRTATDHDQFKRIADFVLSKKPKIPEASMLMAAKLLIDTLGVTAGSSVLEVSRIAREHAVRFMAAGEGGQPIPILFDGRNASISGAAWAAATQTDNLDAHDGFNPVKGHIGCAVVPALMAFAELKPELTGREALEAMVIAYEVGARTGLSLHASVADYHTSGAWNALAVAAMGCRLMGTDEEMLRQALGIAEYHGPRSQMMREIDNPTMLHDGSGMGAMIGIQAVLLAMDGFIGAPAITVEGKSVARFWEDLGSRWTIDENYIKPYPICRWAHAAIDSVRELSLEHDFSVDDIEAIHVRTFHEASRLFMGMPESNSQAQYSLAFSVAVMLLHGKIGPQHIEGDVLSDPQISKLIARIHVSEDEKHQARFPEGRWSDATITLKDGRQLQSSDMPARGGVESPMSDAEFREKFHTMVDDVLGPKMANAIWDANFALLNADRRFSDFSKHCYAVDG